jgi:uncharacterized membrane protein YuzA (DUF378 family)/division protein CdvB (Snf7/Vps24/ESCRT-III family)
MSFKKQFKKIKENWVLIVLAILFLLIFTILFSGIGDFSTGSMKTGRAAYQKMSLDQATYSSNYYGQEDFAPDQEVRKIIKNVNLDLQIKKGEFKEIDSKINNLVTNTDSYILNKNIYENTDKLYNGRYTIKVEESKLEYVSNSLKDLGKVTSYNVSNTDVTGKYTNYEIELNLEKNKLSKLNKLYDQLGPENSKEKVDLIDKIFTQERRVKYLEDRIDNIDEKVEYSTIYLNIKEHSNYVDIAFVKFSNLVKTIVGSINIMLYILFAILPFALVVFIVCMFKRSHKRRSKRRKK